MSNSSGEIEVIHGDETVESINKTYNNKEVLNSAYVQRLLNGYTPTVSYKKGIRKLACKADFMFGLASKRADHVLELEDVIRALNHIMGDALQVDVMECRDGKFPIFRTPHKAAVEKALGEVPFHHITVVEVDEFDMGMDPGLLRMAGDIVKEKKKLATAGTQTTESLYEAVLNDAKKSIAKYYAQIDDAYSEIPAWARPSGRGYDVDGKLDGPLGFVDFEKKRGGLWADWAQMGKFEPMPMREMTEVQRKDS